MAEEYEEKGANVAACNGDECSGRGGGMGGMENTNGISEGAAYALVDGAPGSVRRIPEQDSKTAFWSSPGE